MFVNNLKGYRIVLVPAVEKVLEKIGKVDAQKIEKKLKTLVSGVQNLNVRKIKSKKPAMYGLRVGVYRVLYEVHEEEVVVWVIRIGHRKEVYDF